jgi:muramoyltetrapeptide carboxypeptidase LdcA involved in peptidoglycan recycling
MTDKILLLEARSGGVAQMTTYLSQLQQMGVFGQIRGILLGTLTQMEREKARPEITELVRSFAGDWMPMAKTAWIGHGADSKAIVIGKEIILK